MIIQTLPVLPPCRMPCSHWPYVQTLRWLLAQNRVAEAAVIVERNSEGNSNTPHDWQHELTMEERLTLNTAATAKTIF